MSTASAHLATLERMGAAQFAERHLATDHGAVKSAVRRHRMIRGGSTAAVAVGLVGAATFAAQGLDRSAIQPGVPTGSPTPTTTATTAAEESCVVHPGGVSRTYENGQLPDGALCTMWDGETQLRNDAAIYLIRFNDAHRQEFGFDLCVQEGYRPLDRQQIANERGGGEPGTSSHGHGLAIDLCGNSVGTPTSREWVEDNLPEWGWIRPAESAEDEPWHWVFLFGARELPEEHGLTEADLNLPDWATS